MKLQKAFSFCFSAWLLCASQPCRANGSVAGWGKLVQLIYKLEVINYCGLTSTQSIKGYAQEREQLIQFYALDETLMRSAQAEALDLAYKEWQNRGLGGFRPWCKNEGQGYKEYLENLIVQN